MTAQEKVATTHKSGVFKLVEGLRAVDPKVLADFEKEMADQGIKTIIQGADG